MFGKLIKHEWRATAGTQGILAAAALGVSILAGFVLRALLNFSEELPLIVHIGIVLSLAFMGLALIGCLAAMGILLLVRFYKNKFTDEGYLTFTLPVNSHQIFLSSFVNMAIWSLIAGFVLMVGIFLFVFIGVYDPEVFPTWAELKEVWQMIMQELDIMVDPGYITTMSLQAIISLPYGLVMAMTSITVGAVIAKKHKILAAFGIYYGISYLTGIVTSITTIVLTLRDLNHLGLSSTIPQSSGFPATTQSLVVTLIWEVLLIAGGYILSTQLMKKKLNLP